MVISDVRLCGGVVGGTGDLIAVEDLSALEQRMIDQRVFEQQQYQRWVSSLRQGGLVDSRIALSHALSHAFSQAPKTWKEELQSEIDDWLEGVL